MDFIKLLEDFGQGLERMIERMNSFDFPENRAGVERDECDNDNHPVGCRCHMEGEMSSGASDLEDERDRQVYVERYSGTKGLGNECKCITYKDVIATCWYCMHGQHDKCVANLHGNPNDSCPRVQGLSETEMEADRQAEMAKELITDHVFIDINGIGMCAFGIGGGELCGEPKAKHTQVKPPFDRLREELSGTRVSAVPYGVGRLDRPKLKAIDEFEKEVARLINSLSLENGCDMPDYAIAKYLRVSYENLCAASETKVDWSRVGQVPYQKGV